MKRSSFLKMLSSLTIMGGVTITPFNLLAGSGRKECVFHGRHSRDWLDPRNWQGHRVPGKMGDARIEGDAYVKTPDAFILNNLTIGREGSLYIDAPPITVEGNVTVIDQIEKLKERMRA